MIVHVAYSGVGGTGSFVGELCPKLGKHNGQNSRVLFYGVEPLHNDHGRPLQAAGIQYSVVGKKPGFDTASIFALAREIRNLKPDVVVMHGSGTAWHWPILRLLGVRGRLVLIDHGPYGTGAYSRQLIGILCADAIIAISDPLERLLKSKFSFFIRNKPLCAIPNGIDTNYFRPGGRRRSNDLILNAATFSPMKDQATLIRACSLLSKSRNIRLYLAGDGANRTQLEQLARESGMGEKIQFLGNIGRERLLELYWEAAVFVLSTKTEGISLAMLEAMACGCPMVASDVPGVSEILTGTGAALLVPQGDTSEMAEAIAMILDQPELGASMGNIAREYAVTRYSSIHMAERYREILSTI